MLRNTSYRQLRIITYLGAFFLTLTVSIASYSNSSYLATIVDPQHVGLVYSLGSLLTIISMIAVPHIVCRFGIKLTTILVAALSVGGLTLLIKPDIFPIVAVIGFVLYYSFTQVARYNTDLYLETISDNQKTGGIRGVFMTIINIAWLASPLVAGMLLGAEENFQLVYFVVALLIVPFMIIIGKILPERLVCHPDSHSSNIWQTIKYIFTTKGRGIRYVLVNDFLLNLFYAVMVIYMPLLLHETIGFSWQQIGFIFTIMLIPFVLIEYPLGKLADKFLGERELLAIGFIIAGVCTVTLAILDSSNIYLWAGLLFLTRVGAATIEIMKETALFKRINGQDGPILALSRIMIPLSFIVAAPFAYILLTQGTYQTLFLALGITMLAGVYPSLNLKDAH